MADMAENRLQFVSLRQLFSMTSEKGGFIEKITCKFLSFWRNRIRVRENEGIWGLQDTKMSVTDIAFLWKNDFLKNPENPKENPNRKVVQETWCQRCQRGSRRSSESWFDLFSDIEKRIKESDELLLTEWIQRCKMD